MLQVEGAACDSIHNADLTRHYDAACELQGMACSNVQLTRNTRAYIHMPVATSQQMLTGHKSPSTRLVTHMPGVHQEDLTAAALHR